MPHPPGLRYGSVTRRELLKLSPVLAVGAFAIPSLQPALLERGLQFSDWAAARWFRSSHLAPTFPDDAVVLARFPLNSYLSHDPGVELESWALKVDGEVSRPRECTLEQIRALPPVRQNTRHVCVEGWDVITRFSSPALPGRWGATRARASGISWRCAASLRLSPATC